MYQIQFDKAFLRIDKLSNSYLPDPSGLELTEELLFRSPFFITIMTNQSMAKYRKNFHKQYIDKKIKVSRRIYALIILIMFGIVIYDSFVYILPFYYILYWLAGYFAGKVIWLSQKVVIVKETQSLSLEVGLTGKILSVILLVLRYFVGETILASINIIWITDALYLIFIGVYLSKIISISQQVDEYLYMFFQKSKNPDRKE